MNIVKYVMVLGVLCFFVCSASVEIRGGGQTADADPEDGWRRRRGDIAVRSAKVDLTAPRPPRGSRISTACPSGSPLRIPVALRPAAALRSPDEPASRSKYNTAWGQR